MIRRIRSFLGRCYYNSIRIVNTAYYFILPKKNKLVVNGFFNKRVFYVPKNNFGDELNIYLLYALTKKTIFSESDLLIQPYNLLFIGSIIEAYMNHKSIIWGAGAIGGKVQLSISPYKVLSVRGPLTRNYLLKNNIDCPEVYGDPALLLPILYQPKATTKRYTYGIIPHYVDLSSNKVKSLVKTLNSDCTIISLRNYSSWQDVIDKVNACKFIISSSLHGLIISDAYGIPNVWVEFSNNIAGNRFKYRDYFASFKRKTTDPIIVTKDITESEIRKALNKYVRPCIDMMPFLKNAPIKIMDDLIYRAEKYYRQNTTEDRI